MQDKGEVDPTDLLVIAKLITNYLSLPITPRSLLPLLKSLYPAKPKADTVHAYWMIFMKLQNKWITCSSGNFLVGLLFNTRKSMNTKALEQSQESLPEKSTRRGVVLVCQSTLLATTIGYFLVITLLLTIDSPGKLLTHFFTSSGPSIQAFVRVHQTAIHFLSFYLLAILICSCFKNISYWIAILFMVAYAVVTELAQMPLPNRHSDAGDLLANLAGIGCGVVSVWVMFHMTLRHLLKRSSLRE